MFFHPHHHRSIFPLLIVALSLALATAVVLLIPPGGGGVRLFRPSARVSVSSYERQAGSVLSTFDERYALASTDDARFDVASAAVSALLSLRVPSAEKDVHLDLVIALNQIAEGARLSQSFQVEQGLARLSSARATLSHATP